MYERYGLCDEDNDKWINLDELDCTISGRDFTYRIGTKYIYIFIWRQLFGKIFKYTDKLDDYNNWRHVKHLLREESGDQFLYR